jgi:hypothetical protein
MFITANTGFEFIHRPIKGRMKLGFYNNSSYNKTKRELIGRYILLVLSPNLLFLTFSQFKEIQHNNAAQRVIL